VVYLFIYFIPQVKPLNRFQFCLGQSQRVVFQRNRSDWQPGHGWNSKSQTTPGLQATAKIEPYHPPALLLRESLSC